MIGDKCIIKQGLFVQINILTKEGALWGKDGKAAICFFNYNGIPLPDGTNEDDYIFGFFGGLVEVKLEKVEMKHILIKTPSGAMKPIKGISKIVLLEIKDITQKVNQLETQTRE
jgi:hypothetical protein